MKLIALCLLIAIACNYVDETEAQFWDWGGFWPGMGWNRPIWGGSWWGRPWLGGRPWWRRPFWFKRSLEEMPTFECEFDGSSKLFRCDGLNKTVECDALSVLDKTGPRPFNQFKLSAEPSAGLKTKVEEMKYSLYPRKLESETWFDTMVEDMETKKSFTYSLYQLPQYTDSGLRVVSPVCWRKLVELFSEPSVKIDKLSVLKETGKMEDVKIMGEITIKP